MAAISATTQSKLRAWNSGATDTDKGGSWVDGRQKLGIGERRDKNKVGDFVVKKVGDKIKTQKK